MRVFLTYEGKNDRKKGAKSIRKGRITMVRTRCFRNRFFLNLVLLELSYPQQIKRLILYLPHFRTTVAISVSSRVKIIGSC